MSTGIYSAVTGMKSKERELEAVSHNIANASTAGFKEVGMVFEAVMSRQEKNGQTDTMIMPFNSSEEMFVNHEQGASQQTGGDLDLAIQGEGFFVVQTEQGLRFTRNGRFKLNDSGQVVTTQGHMVSAKSGQLVVDGASVQVSEDGALMVDNEEQGGFRIVRFNEESALEPVGNGLFKAPESAGMQDFNTPQVMQGMFEQSNVNVVKNLMKLIKSSHAMESYQRSIVIMSKIEEKVINDAGKMT